MENVHERELLAAEFDRHADEEGKILADYRALSNELGQGVAGFLVNLILTEEELHHFLLRTTAQWLRSPPTAEGTMLPAAIDRDALLRRTHELQRHETESIEACRRLRSALSGPHADVLASVIEVVALDSEKHHRLLLAVERTLAPDGTSSR